MMKIRSSFSLILLVGTLVAGFCRAADSEKAPTRTIRASGDATVTAAPDRAEITIGVTTLAPSAQAAGTQNAGASKHVMDAIKGIIAGKGECKTAGYSLDAQYDFNGGKRKFNGYQAVNTLRVELDDLSLPGKVIDAALEAGATDVNGIVFTLRDESKVRQEALGRAAAQARSSAEAIATALNLHVVGVLQAETGQVPIAPRPVAMFAKNMAMAEATPITPGTLDIHATVTVTLLVE